MSDDPKRLDGGYTPGFLAFKHGISVRQAAELIKRIGLNRPELDQAAQALSDSAAPDR